MCEQTRNLVASFSTFEVPLPYDGHINTVTLSSRLATAREDAAQYSVAAAFGTYRLLERHGPCLTLTADMPKEPSVLPRKKKAQQTCFTGKKQLESQVSDR